MSVTRIHNTPRTCLFSPLEDPANPPPIPLSEIDVFRVTTTNLDTVEDREIQGLLDGDLRGPPPSSRSLDRIHHLLQMAARDATRVAPGSKGTPCSYTEDLSARRYLARRVELLYQQGQESFYSRLAEATAKDPRSSLLSWPRLSGRP